MSTVWKFELTPSDVQEIEMPVGAKGLFAAIQYDKVCLWALVDPIAAKEKRRIAVVGTGHPAPANEAAYVGSVILHGGALVFHIFVEPPA